MANDDVLRLRATVVSEEALANIRAIGREIGLVPQKARPAIIQTNTLFAQLTQTVKNLGSEVTRMVPSLGGFGIGAAGAGLAAAALIRTLTSVSSKIVELRYASKELGMSERDLRAWSLAAEKAGIAPEAMMSGLKGFKETTEEFKYNIGGVRDELIALGAGPVVQRIMAATTQTNKLKEAFDFKEALLKADPSGYKARRFMDMMKLGADSARLSWEEFSAAMAKTKPLSKEDEERAKKFHDAMIDLGHAWDQLVQRTAIKLFPVLDQDIKDLQGLISLFEKADGLLDKWLPGKGGGNLMGRMTAPFVPGSGPSQSLFPRAPNLNPRSGYKPTSFGDGFGGGEMSEFSKAVKVGVFEALVEFKSFVEGGGAAGGGAGGFTPASFGGSAGAAAGGGVGGRAPGAAGFGGGGYTNLGSGGGGGGPTFRRGVGPGARGGPGTPGQGPFTVGKGGDPRGLEQHIRDTAKKYGVDPDTAMRVASSEGLRDFLGDNGKSGGAFQLFTGGGLGNEFQKETGLDPLDPKNEKATIDYALKRAATGGWGPWHGAKRVGVGPREGLPNGQAPSGGGSATGAEGDQSSRPYRMGGQVSVGGKTFDWGSGGSGRGSIPYGSFPINIGKGDIGPIGQRIGSVATVGGASGMIDDPKFPGAPRAGIQIHPGSGDTLEQLYTQGCFSVPRGQWPAFKATLLAEAAKHPEGMNLSIGRRGVASITPNAPRAAATSRIDGAVANSATGNQNVTGNVNLTVNSNGTAAKTKADADGLWQKTTIQNYKQMQPTEKPQWGASG